MSAVFSGYNLSHSFITAVYRSVHGLGKWFVPELRLPFAQISPSYRKTAAKV